MLHLDITLDSMYNSASMMIVQMVQHLMRGNRPTAQNLGCTWITDEGASGGHQNPHFQSDFAKNLGTHIF